MDEMLTEAEIEEAWSVYVSGVPCMIRMANVFDMARLAATEIRQDAVRIAFLEKEASESYDDAEKLNLHKNELEAHIDELEMAIRATYQSGQDSKENVFEILKQLAASAQQVERMREALDGLVDVANFCESQHDFDVAMEKAEKALVSHANTESS